MGPMLAWVSNWCLAIYERRSRNHYWFGSLLTYYQQVLLMLLLAVMSSPWSERFPRCTRKMNVWMRAKGSIRNLPFLPTLFFFFLSWLFWKLLRQKLLHLCSLMRLWLLTGESFSLPGLPLSSGRMHTLSFRDWEMLGWQLNQLLTPLTPFDEKVLFC